LIPLAASLAHRPGSEAGSPPAPTGSSTSGARGRTVPINVFDPHTWSPNGTGAALVLVLPGALKKNVITDANRLVALSRLPVLGVITYKRARSPKANRHPLGKVIRSRVPQ
jgi:hypothetical protein